jgi:hypothetical protein
MSEDLRLLKTQRNTILSLVQNVGLAPIDCRWHQAEVMTNSFGNRSLVSIFTHVPTQFYYRFGPEYDVFSPGPASRTGDVKASIWDTTRISLVRLWLSYVKREYEAPDLWGLLRQEKKLLQLATSPNLPNDSFTEPEKQIIRNQLAEIKQQLISVHHLQLQQGEITDQGFSYLADSLNRVGKKDWLNITITTLASIAIAAAFAPDVAQDMIQRVMSAIYPIFEPILKLLG